MMHGADDQADSEDSQRTMEYDPYADADSEDSHSTVEYATHSPWAGRSSYPVWSTGLSAINHPFLTNFSGLQPLLPGDFQVAAHAMVLDKYIQGAHEVYTDSEEQEYGFAWQWRLEGRTDRYVRAEVPQYVLRCIPYRDIPTGVDGSDSARWHLAGRVAYRQHITVIKSSKRIMERIYMGTGDFAGLFDTQEVPNQWYEATRLMPARGVVAAPATIRLASITSRRATAMLVVEAYGDSYPRVAMWKLTVALTRLQFEVEQTTERVTTCARLYRECWLRLQNIMRMSSPLAHEEQRQRTAMLREIACAGTRYALQQALATQGMDHIGSTFFPDQVLPHLRTPPHDDNLPLTPDERLRILTAMHPPCMVRRLL